MNPLFPSVYAFGFALGVVHLRWRFVGLGLALVVLAAKVLLAEEVVAGAWFALYALLYFAPLLGFGIGSGLLVRRFWMRRGG